MSNLIYKITCDALVKILKIESVKLMVFKKEEDLIKYLDTKDDLSHDEKLDILVSTAHGVTLQTREVLIKEYCIVQPHPIVKQIAKIEILAHEMRHVWQLQNGWIFDNSLPYALREHEKDAYKFSISIAGTLIALFGFAEIYVISKTTKGVIKHFKK